MDKKMIILQFPDLTWQHIFDMEFIYYQHDIPLSKERGKELIVTRQTHNLDADLSKVTRTSTRSCHDAP